MRRIRNNMIKRTTSAKKAPSSSQLVKRIVGACSDAKGRDIVVLDVSKSFSVASYFVIVSGRSDRQVQGISNRILHDLHQVGFKPYSTDGLEQGQWVLLDCDDVVVHVFYEPLRSHYNLESLWASAKKVNIEKYIAPAQQAAA